MLFYLSVWSKCLVNMSILQTGSLYYYILSTKCRFLYSQKLLNLLAKKKRFHCSVSVNSITFERYNHKEKNFCEGISDILIHAYCLLFWVFLRKIISFCVPYVTCSYVALSKVR